jgi:O-antigen ligase
MQAIELAPGNLTTRHTLAEALAPVEYGYYFVMFYTILGAPLGLIIPGGIGSGFLLIPVLGLCAIALGPLLLPTIRSAWLPVTCGVSYLFIQLAVHGESLDTPYVYGFGPWIISLIIVQSLLVFRPNFLHRFALFTLFMGVAMLPFVSFHQTGAYQRIGLEHGVGYGNPNAMAAWFGFCTLYLTIRGYVEKRSGYRLTALLMAVVSLYIVTLTLSRGALIAIAASILVASRRLLKRSLFPLVLLAILLLGLLELGVFDQAVHSYTLRAGEETGRFRVWPLLIEKFLNSPLIGVGASHAGAWSTGKFFTPHNSFLFFAVASGIIPLILFCAYCFRSGMVAYSHVASRDSLFYLPLVTYTILIMCAGNFDFMMPWGIVSLAAPIAASVSRMNQSDVQAPRSLLRAEGVR